MSWLVQVQYLHSFQVVVDLLAEEAVVHLLMAVKHDAGFSAAWKLLGKAQLAAGNKGAAADAYRAGIAAAEKKGDRQAMKEMQVFLRRVEKEIGKHAG